jgi:hypothetical protein
MSMPRGEALRDLNIEWHHHGFQLEVFESDGGECGPERYRLYKYVPTDTVGRNPSLASTNSPIIAIISLIIVGASSFSSGLHTKRHKDRRRHWEQNLRMSFRARSVQVAIVKS